jgi:hypothetical protein
MYWMRLRRKRSASRCSSTSDKAVFIAYDHHRRHSPQRAALAHPAAPAIIGWIGKQLLANDSVGFGPLLARCGCTRRSAAACRIRAWPSLAVRRLRMAWSCRTLVVLGLPCLSAQSHCLSLIFLAPQLSSFPVLATQGIARAFATFLDPSIFGLSPSNAHPPAYQRSDGNPAYKPEDNDGL